MSSVFVASHQVAFSLFARTNSPSGKPVLMLSLGLYNSIVRELVSEFTLTSNQSMTTTSLLRTMCHKDDSILLGTWLQETDHKSVEDQVSSVWHTLTYLYHSYCLYGGSTWKILDLGCMRNCCFVQQDLGEFSLNPNFSQTFHRFHTILRNIKKGKFIKHFFNVE